MSEERSATGARDGFGAGALSVPVKMTLVVGASIFAVEFVIMLVLPLFHLPPLLETAIDAASLLVVVAPVLYAFILRPLTAEIAARKKAELGLRRLNAELEARIAQRTRDLTAALEDAGKAAVAKDQFLASMSHEIRTPLNAVIGMTQLLLHSPQPAEQREFTRMAHMGAQALLSIVSDILDFSKLAAGKVELETADFGLLPALEECARLAAAQAHEKGLELVVDADPGLPAAVRGDAARLRQVVLNLLNNAVKFTERGEVLLRAAVSARAEGAVVVRCEVRDTGIGIAPEARGKLFQSFSQADSSTTRRFGGTGLGLAISRRLVEMMGGRIGVDSEPQKGSTFWLEVPFADAAVPVPPTAPAGLSGRRVLVVDDNATCRAALKSRLDSWGMRCTELADGAQALPELRRAAAAGDPYRAAVVDVQMPGMDGLSVARAIRGDSGSREVAVVLLTSLDLAADPHREDADACLMKPVRSSALRSALARTDEKPADEPSASGALVRGRESDRILVVEDNRINQILAGRQLEKLGFPSDVVGNGRLALSVLAARRYALVLMDCHMPEMDGFETAAAIRRMEAPLSRVPIVAMTADAFSGDRERCLAAGMDDYLSKPVTLESLSRILARWISGEDEAAGAAGPPRALLSWKEDYSVGVRSLDTHHKALFAVLNELHAAIRGRRGGEVIGDILKRLLDYTRYHFGMEEALMAQVGYPDLEKHRSQHEAFAASVSGLNERFEKGETSVTLDTLNFLQSWLNGHILGSDKDYARFIAGRGGARAG